MTNNTFTRSHLIEALNEVVSLNSLTANGFDVEVAADAIVAGEVTPDSNDGLIDDDAMAMAFGAFMADGRWWAK
jgi:hypothetical protein